MLIVRELVSGLQNFNQIARGLPGISRSLLSERLVRMEACGIIERVPNQPRGHRYELTPAGRELEDVVVAMGSWASEWAFGLPNEDELDPGLLLFWMERRLNVDALPTQRVTIAFDFLLGRKGQFWFVIADGEASTCLEDPGFEIALSVTADLSAFYQVWLGKNGFAVCVEGGPDPHRGHADVRTRLRGLVFVEPDGRVRVGCAGE